MNLISPLDRQTPDTLRRELADIESRVKKIVGQSPCMYFDERQASDKALKLHELLMLRKECLNSMFRGTPEEFERLSRLNNKLIDLNDEMRRRVVTHHDALAELVKGYNLEQFDVKGYIYPGVSYFPEEGVKQVVTLEDDDFYKSDFCYMCFVCHQNGVEMALVTSYLASHTYRFLDDDWPAEFAPEADEYRYVPLYHQPALCRIVNEPLVRLLGIKYPTYYAMIFTYFSIPDLLRIETFEVEVETYSRESIHIHK